MFLVNLQSRVDGWTSGRFGTGLIEETKLGRKMPTDLETRPLSVSFLFRTSGKEYHSQAGSTTFFAELDLIDLIAKKR